MDWSGLYSQFLTVLGSLLNWILPLVIVVLAIAFGSQVVGMLLGVFSRKSGDRSVRVIMGDETYWTTQSGLSRMKSQPGVLITRGKPTRSVIHYLDEDTGVEQGSAEIEEYDDKAL